jgi:hypothetical protein
MLTEETEMATIKYCASNNTGADIYLFVYVYIYIYVCVCVCVFIISRLVKPFMDLWIQKAHYLTKIWNLLSSWWNWSTSAPILQNKYPRLKFFPSEVLHVIHYQMCFTYLIWVILLYIEVPTLHIYPSTSASIRTLSSAHNLMHALTSEWKYITEIYSPWRNSNCQEIGKYCRKTCPIGTSQATSSAVSSVDVVQ